MRIFTQLAKSAQVFGGFLLELVVPLHPEDRAIRLVPKATIFRKLTQYPIPHDSGMSCVRLDTPLASALIHGLKYRGQQEYAKVLGRAVAYIADWLLQEHPEMERWVLVPIPASTTGLSKRGYNQAALIATAMATEMGSRVTTAELLTRLDKREAQTKMSGAKARAKNMHHAFVAHIPREDCASGFILIDDVRTTGATLKEGERALQKAGARLIFSLAVAQTPKSGTV